MTRRVKSLAVEAKQELSICCQTLCDRQLVEKYIQHFSISQQVSKLFGEPSLDPKFANRLFCPKYILPWWGQ